jgi:hypothetical protein
MLTSSTLTVGHFGSLLDVLLLGLCSSGKFRYCCYLQKLGIMFSIACNYDYDNLQNTRVQSCSIIIIRVAVCYTSHVEIVISQLPTVALKNTSI